jgi:copper chaperone CopZ
VRYVPSLPERSPKLPLTFMEASAAVHPVPLRSSWQAITVRGREWIVDTASISTDRGAAPVGRLRSAACAHVLPGRLRLRVDGLKCCPGLCRSIEHELRRLGGVRRVEASAVTGSILVAYDHTVLDQRDVQAALLAWDVVVDAPLGPVDHARARGAASASPAPASGVARQLMGAVVRSGLEAAIQSAVQSAVRQLLA